MHHRRRRHARERAVGEKPAEADREKQERLEALDDRKIEEDEADRDHDELAYSVGHAEQRLHLVSRDETADVVEVAAVPVEVLVPIAVAVCRERLFLGALRLGEIARDERRRLLLQKGAQPRVRPHVRHFRERRLPGRRRIGAGLRAERADRDEESHQCLLHCQSLFSHPVSRWSRERRRSRPCRSRRR